MVGFNYKSLVLQIIHGSVLLGMILFIFVSPSSLKDYTSDYSSATILFSIFILASFIIGVIIDFLADCLESIVIYLKLMPPVYYMLNNGRRFGITLAHHSYILNKLCEIASKHYILEDKKVEDKKVEDKDKRTKEWFKDKFKKKDKKEVNYILQVAKNRAFRKCKEVQKDQIDSFFMLYVFSRNIALSLMLSSGLLFYGFFYKEPITTVAYGFVFLSLSILFILASYRYYLYYLRILLGSSLKIKCSKNDIAEMSKS